MASIQIRMQKQLSFLRSPAPVPPGRAPRNSRDSTARRLACQVKNKKNRARCPRLSGLLPNSAPWQACCTTGYAADTSGKDADYDGTTTTPRIAFLRGVFTRRTNWKGQSATADRECRRFFLRSPGGGASVRQCGQPLNPSIDPRSRSIRNFAEVPTPSSKMKCRDGNSYGATVPRPARKGRTRRNVMTAVAVLARVAGGAWAAPAAAMASVSQLPLPTPAVPAQPVPHR